MLFHQRMIMLQIVDSQWKDHLYALDHLKEGIGLRGYGQRDPLVEYKKESFTMFQALMDRIDEEILRWVFLYQPVVRAARRGAASRRPGDPPARAPASAGADRGGAPRATARASSRARAGAGGRSAAAAQPHLQRPERGALGLRAAAEPQEAQGGGDEVADGAPRGQEGRPQRSLPLRQREEVQEVPRGQ